MPRKKGSITCQMMETAVSPSCGKMARVEVTVRMKNGQGGYSKIKTLRCWVHYLALENAARKSSTMSVVEAKLFRSRSP